MLWLEVIYSEIFAEYLVNDVVSTTNFLWTKVPFPRDDYTSIQYTTTGILIKTTENLFKRYRGRTFEIIRKLFETRQSSAVKKKFLSRHV